MATMVLVWGFEKNLSKNQFYDISQNLYQQNLPPLPDLSTRAVLTMFASCFTAELAFNQKVICWKNWSSMEEKLDPGSSIAQLQT